jgi:hypothetical protein
VASGHGRPGPRLIGRGCGRSVETEFDAHGPFNAVAGRSSQTRHRLPLLIAWNDTVRFSENDGTGHNQINCQRNNMGIAGKTSVTTTVARDWIILTP